LRPGAGEADGYALPDFLARLGSERLREKPVPGSTWDALADLVSEPGPRSVLAREAARRGLLQNAYLLALPLAEDGRHAAATGIVAAQCRRWGDTDGAVRLWSQAAQRGDVHAMCGLAECAEERDDQPEADGWWLKAADRGEPYAIFQLSDRLSRRGEAAAAEDVLRRAALAGEPYAFVELVKRWTEQERLTDVKTLEESVARRGHLVPSCSMNDHYLLAATRTWAGVALRGGDEQALRRAAEQGHAGGMGNLAEFLARDGRAAEAEEWWARAAVQGHPRAIRHFAEACLQSGATGEAEAWLLRLAHTDDTRVLWYLADLKDRAGREAEAEQFLRRAVTNGDRHALRHLVERLQRAGRPDEAERLLRGALEQGHGGSLLQLADSVEARGRETEARHLRIYGIEPGGASAAPWGPAGRMAVNSDDSGALFRA
jgi:TPR repeat protein